ncbi:type II toxin-antitoxin system RelE/ParE family toxin [Beijerinckia sp. L45]|uniref:type II toxin-antitoxin system RelE/ParE family toxin n=1 Tax=Beijerinckia sp. L45 TaxID=1641855 RepID=UPI00131CDFF4|nr:type II toxin-antitoxin system RelE/ParE family toxin [Beijerinckia sp. L45]
MIVSFKNKGLAELFATARSAKIPRPFHGRISRQLSALGDASVPSDMDIPGWGFHALKGFKPIRYAVSVNGPWRLTFEFDGPDACRVDFEQYH